MNILSQILFLVFYVIYQINSESLSEILKKKSAEELAKETFSRYQTGIQLKSWNIFLDVLREDFTITQCDNTYMDRTYFGDRVTRAVVELKTRTGIILESKVSGEYIKFTVNASGFSKNTFEGIFNEEKGKFLLISEKMSECKGYSFLTSIIDDNLFMRDSVFYLTSRLHHGIRTKDEVIFRSAVTSDFEFTCCPSSTYLDTTTIFDYLKNIDTPVPLNVISVYANDVKYDSEKEELMFSEHQTVAIYNYTAEYDEDNHNFRISSAEPFHCFNQVNSISLINRKEVGMRIAKKILKNYKETIELQSKKRLKDLIDEPFKIIHCDDSVENVTIDEYFDRIVASPVHLIDSNAESTISIESDYDLDEEEIQFHVKNNYCSEKRIEALEHEDRFVIHTEERYLCAKCEGFDRDLYKNVEERRKNANLMNIAETLLERYLERIESEEDFEDVIDYDFEIGWIDQENQNRKRKWMDSDSFKDTFPATWQHLKVYKVEQNGDETIRFTAKYENIENEYTTVIIDEEHFITLEQRKTKTH